MFVSFKINLIDFFILSYTNLNILYSIFKNLNVCVNVEIKQLS